MMTKDSEIDIKSRSFDIAQQEVELKELGNELAKTEGYDGIHGVDAIYLYLIKKYLWKPSYVKQMPTDDICLVLNTERNKFKQNKEKSDSKGWQM